MCDKCQELEEKIERYRRLTLSINDRLTIDGCNQLIKDAEAEKAKLHPDREGEASPRSGTVAIGTMLSGRTWQTRGCQMPRYFFDVKNGHRLFDASGFVCEDDTDAIIRATVLAIGVSLDTPEDEPERRIAIINDAGREIGNVPVYSRPSYKNPAK